MTTQKSQKQAQILKVKLSSTSKDEVLAKICSALKKKAPFLIITPNPEIIVHAQTNLKLRGIINQADLSLPDGVGLIIASKILHIQKLTLFKGRELFVDLLTLAHQHKLKVFLLGSTPSANQASLTKAKSKFPDLNIKGTSGPILNPNSLPVSERDATLQFDTIKKINQFQPDILILAFGTPKQEVWFDLHRSELKVKVVACLGGSLDFYSGKKSLPPKIFSRLGLEWLWRGLHEKGHWRRVFRATVIFPWLMIKRR